MLKVEYARLCTTRGQCHVGDDDFTLYPSCRRIWNMSFGDATHHKNPPTISSQLCSAKQRHSMLIGDHWRAEKRPSLSPRDQRCQGSLPCLGDDMDGSEVMQFAPISIATVASTMAELSSGCPPTPPRWLPICSGKCLQAFSSKMSQVAASFGYHSMANRHCVLLRVRGDNE